MALKIRLNPQERILVGGAVIRNGSTPATMLLENTVAVLREKDILTPERATTVCERLYLIVQLMYIDPEQLPKYHKTYWQIAHGIVEAAPSLLELIEGISQQILQGEYYKALKVARRLIEREQELIENA